MTEAVSKHFLLMWRATARQLSSSTWAAKCTR